MAQKKDENKTIDLGQRFETVDPEIVDDADAIVGVSPEYVDSLYARRNGLVEDAEVVEDVEDDKDDKDTKDEDIKDAPAPAVPATPVPVKK